jgi:hypothetical protein
LPSNFGGEAYHLNENRPIEVFYEEVKLGGFYLDFLVGDCSVLELEAVEQLTS